MFGNVYEGKRVLITGNTGFKGTWLTLWLLELGADVWGFADDVPTNPSLYEILGLQQRITDVRGDVRDYTKFQQVVQDCQPDFIFHLAAQSITLKSYEEPLETLGVNSMGIANLLESIRHLNKACSVVIITSDKCYLNLDTGEAYKEGDRLGGIDPYSASKAAAEIFIYAYTKSYFNKDDQPIRVVSARAGNIVGGGDWADRRLMPDIFKAWSNEELLEIRNPEATRPWNFVLESLSGYLHLGAELSQKTSLKGEAFNFGPQPGNHVNVETLVTAMSSSWGTDTAKFVIKPSQYKGHESTYLHLDIGKAAQQLSWSPILTIQQTVDFVCSWYKCYYAGKQNIVDFSTQQLQQYIALAQKSKEVWTR